MTHCFFFPLTEAEFWFQLGISQLIREYDKDVRLTLLFPDHPRVRGRFQDIIYTHFDSVVDLPYFSPSKDWHKVLRKKHDFIQRLKQVEFPKKTIVFGSGMRQLVHFVLNRYIRSIRSGYSHLIVNVQAYVDVSQKATIGVKQSLQMSAFSVVLARVITLEYIHPATKGPLERKCYPKLYDVRINIENTVFDSHRVRVFNNIPFPLRCVEPLKIHHRKSIELDRNAILVFLDSNLTVYGICDEEYWNRAEELVQKVTNLCKGSTIYIKLHPGSSDAFLPRVRRMGGSLLDKTTSAEEIYFFNRGCIRCVLSGASTSLITASWSGIPAYDCSLLLGYNQEYVRDFRPYFSHAPEIRHVGTFSDLERIAAAANDSEIGEERKRFDLKQEWNHVLNEIGMICEL